MAKTQEKVADVAPAPERGKGLAMVIVVGLLAGVAGGAVPHLVTKSDTKTDKLKGRPTPVVKEAALFPFGDTVVVNLHVGYHVRYLRVKFILTVAAEEKTFDDLLSKKKPFLKHWLIGYLSNLSLEEVSGAASINRIRREIRERFNAMLFPDGVEKIDDVLFEEFVVQ